MSAADRRQSPRFDAHDRVRIEMLPQGLALTVVDFSFGGFRAECIAPLGPETRQFRISTTDGVKREELPARAVYCHRLGAPGDTPSYVIGFAFQNTRDPKVESRILGILDHVAATQNVA